MLNRPTNAVTKRAVMLVGAVLAMIAMLVISSPAPNGIFAHPHDTGQTHTDIGVALDTDDRIHIHYDENDTRPVRSFESIDPEGSAIEWNVRGVDAADFDISSTGVLTFMESPDYENPTDRGLNLNAADEAGNPDFADTGEFAPDDNNYQITVSATEMRVGANAPLPAKRTDLHLTVVVENVDDPGELTLQWLQPEVTTKIDAILTDPDGNATSTTWTWYTSKVADPEVGTDFHWNVIANETHASYTPVAVDEDKYLWVRVAYTDPQGAAKTADAKSMNPVRAEVSPGANASPDFEDDTDTRTVPESTAVDDPVGDPVTATDTDNDIVTYELMAAASPNDRDDEFFEIDRASGQIMVAQALDYDAVGGRATTTTPGTYMVKVRATDPSGEADNIMVTITAENVNEAPIVTGRAELSVVEGTTDITVKDAKLVYTGLPDAPGINAPADPTDQQNEYVYQDPDVLDSIFGWTLEGDDADAFENSGRFEPRYLQFKEAPDYENPTDMNRDNVYEVTLVATDTDPLGTGAGIGKVNVWLTVTNVEEAGKVVFTEGETAYLNEMLVAEVQDPDDHGGALGEPHQGVHIVNWQWSRSQHEADPNDPFMDISGETTNRYTPEDFDRGYYLRATARYTDPLRAEDDPSTMADERIGVGSLRTEMATTENAVRVAPGRESAPTFPDGTGTVTRYVAEDTASGEDVGAPVAAKAANVNETLDYTLEGTDAKYFNIGSMGQITVGGDVLGTPAIEPGTDPELDYDDPMKKQRFSVTVKVEVTGGDANQNAQVDVDIIVTNVGELPVITGPKPTVNYAEIEDGEPNTADVATYVGTDPEGATISWDVRGADAALFTIAGGVLRFVNSPDFENPKDVLGADTATPDAVAENNVYDIVIRAIASRASRASDDTRPARPAETVDTQVAVTVTDVDEDGEVVISLLQPEVGIKIMASLTDSDGGVTSVTWQWTVSEVAANLLEIDRESDWGVAPGGGPTTKTYTPDGADLTDMLVTNDGAIDEGKYLRVTATYTDTNGANKMARAMSAYPVQARGLGANNESPDFEGDKVERSVEETAEMGDDVLGEVVATVVARSDTDILTYGLRAFTAADLGSTGVTPPADPAADVAAFDIDKATGQITVAQKLDFESRGPVGNRDGKYIVVATVTDPTNLGDSIVVVITAEDINEDPVLSGRPELTINEIDSSDENAANPDFVGNPTPGDVNVYNVVDQDRRAATKQWSLEGDDKDKFQLIDEGGRTLVFVNQPDYETPADADGDNVYKVTIVTLDGNGGRGEFDVCIAVMNIDEAGKITLFDEDGVELVQPRALGPITARLTDPDVVDVTDDVTWQWAKSQLDPPVSPDPRNIAGEESETYTPTNNDTSFFLRVTAMYTDGAEKITAGPRTAVVTTPHSVLEVEDKKRPPAFTQDAIEVEVAENSLSTTYVGEAIDGAVDPDKGTTLIYTLVGDDAVHFALATSTRQIVVGHPTDLNKEEKNSYTVELKASDGALSDTLMVTIEVTDRNEAPSTPVKAKDAPAPDPTPANNAPVFPAATDTREVAENTATGTDVGDPVMATDADAGDTLTYTLGGADMASFDIASTTGQLMTKDPLDFETKASYTVTVTASDGTDDAMVTVTITVTDVEEPVVAGDTDGNGMISKTEVITAFRAYISGQYTKAQIIAIFQQYAADAASSQ